MAASRIYLECSAQVTKPSITGRIVYPITDLFLVQLESLLKCYGPKAQYKGGLIEPKGKRCPAPDY